MPSQTSPETPPETLAVPHPSTTVASETDVARFRGEPLDALLEAMETRPVVGVGRRVNHHCYQLDLGNGLTVAFKPDRRLRHDLWRADVAACALARLLGLGARVPPVTVRAVPLAALRPGPRDGLLVQRRASGMVFGSVIYWMPVLSPSGLHSRAARARWSRWLDPRLPLPAEHSAMAEELSSLVVLDYLQTNVDRWHSGNLSVDEAGHLVYRDNDEAWVVAPMGSVGVNAGLLRAVGRFSRSLVAALRRADAGALRTALAPWARAAGRPVLGETILGNYDRRRRFALAHIDRLIRRYGERVVLPWP